MMLTIEEIKKVVSRNMLALYENSSGVLLIEFPAVGSMSPLLLSADEGETWCPEVSGQEAKMWSGNICLVGIELEKEIREMYLQLKLGSPDLMLKVAFELQSVELNRIYS